MTAFRFLPHFAMGLVLLWAAACLASAPRLNGMADEGRSDPSAEQPRFLSGKKFEDALTLRGRLVYERSPLRKVVAEFQKTSRLPIVVDRRINPDQRVTIRTRLVTNRTTLVTLADQLGARVSFGRCYVYIGPEASATSLQTRVALLEERLVALRKDVDPALYRSLTTKFDGSWGRLSVPRFLLEQRAAELGVVLSDANVIGHDLWNAAILPSISFVDYASLILTQFDLELTLDSSGQFGVQPDSGPAIIERPHRVSLRNKSDVVRLWRKSLPDVEVTWRGSTAIVSTTVENHQTLEMLARGERPPTDTPGGLRSQEFTFRTPPRTRLGTVLASLRASVPVRLVGRTEAELQEELNQFVEINEDNTPSEQFFSRALAGLKGRVEVTDEEVIVTFE